MSGDAAPLHPSPSAEVSTEPDHIDAAPHGEETRAYPTAQDGPAPETGQTVIVYDLSDAQRTSPAAETPLDVDMSVEDPSPEDVPMVQESVPQEPSKSEASNAAEKDLTLPDKTSAEEQTPDPLSEDIADVPPHNEEEHAASDVENMLRETQSMDEVSRELEPAEEEQSQPQVVDEEKAGVTSLGTEPNATVSECQDTFVGESVAEECAGSQPPGDERAVSGPMEPVFELKPPQEPAATRREVEEVHGTGMHSAEPATSPSKHDSHADSAPNVQQPAEVITTNEELMDVDDDVPTEDHLTELRPAEEQTAGNKLAEEQPVEDQPFEKQAVEEQSIEKQPVEEQPMEERCAEGQSVEGQLAEDQPLEDHLAAQHAEDQAAEDQLAEGRPTDAAVDHTTTAVAEEEEESDDEPPRIIIIEHLDTPATRREKYLQKRLERQRKQAEAEAAERAARGRAGDDAKSDLSDLSDLSDGGEGASPADEDADEVEKEPGAVVLGEGEHLEGGTLGALP